MENNVKLGAAQVAGGSYIAYKGIEHGLPRALGLRIEYHTTGKQNAKLIKKAGNILDPKFGGRGGWSEAIQSTSYMNNSKNFVHITGAHPNEDVLENTVKPICRKLPKSMRGVSEKVINFVFRPVHRKIQCIMYKTIGNMKDLNRLINNPKSKKRYLKKLPKVYVRMFLKMKQRDFAFPG